MRYMQPSYELLGQLRELPTEILRKLYLLADVLGEVIAVAYEVEIVIPVVILLQAIADQRDVTVVVDTGKDELQRFRVAVLGFVDNDPSVLKVHTSKGTVGHENQSVGSPQFVNLAREIPEAEHCVIHGSPQAVRLFVNAARQEAVLQKSLGHFLDVYDFRNSTIGKHIDHSCHRDDGLARASAGLAEGKDTILDALE